MINLAKNRATEKHNITEIAVTLYGRGAYQGLERKLKSLTILVYCVIINIKVRE